MRKIFLDVGAGAGSSVNFFRGNHPQAYEFEIHSFEPLPENIEVLKQVPGVTVIGAAAWISNGKATLYLGKKKSSSMYSDKRTGGVDHRNKIKIPTIDLAEYIRNNFSKNDEIWLKLNIEGAEYKVIPHLYKHGLLKWMDRIYIKWHAHKISSLEKYHKEVKKMVPNFIGSWRRKEALPLV